MQYSLSANNAQGENTIHGCLIGTPAKKREHSFFVRRLRKRKDFAQPLGGNCIAPLYEPHIA